jgi:hypothetical protein
VFQRWRHYRGRQSNTSKRLSGYRDINLRSQSNDNTSTNRYIDSYSIASACGHPYRCDTSFSDVNSYGYSHVDAAHIYRNAGSSNRDQSAANADGYAYEHGNADTADGNAKSNLDACAANGNASEYGNANTCAVQGFQPGSQP